MAILSGPGKRDSPVTPLLAGLRDGGDHATCGPGPRARWEAHHEAIPGSGDAAAVQEVDVPSELLSRVLARLPGQEGQQVIHLHQAFDRAALQGTRAMPLREDTVGTEERY